eukprot:scaffold3378_cov104-Cylindrotheca_fusiformis.AAC.6
MLNYPTMDNMDIGPALPNRRPLDRRSSSSDGPPKIPSRKHSIRKLNTAANHECSPEMCPLSEKLESTLIEDGGSEEVCSIKTEDMTPATLTSGASTEKACDLVGKEFEVEAAILARIPAHIRNQLSKEEWLDILDSDGPDTSDGYSESFCSDITDDVSELMSSSRRSGLVSNAPPCKAQKTNKSVVISEPAVVSEPEQPQRNQPRRRVSFGDVQIRTHERILEVHPCTSSGPSLGLGWNYEDEETPKAIDWSKRNRGASQLRLNREKRERIVREDLGYSSREVAFAIRECLRIKNQRRRTINNLKECNNIVPVEKVEYMVERCHRKMRSIRKRFRIPSASAA